ncbi:TPA: hypothetical protein ACS2QH_004505 [Yersinia enterocolitica]
MSLSCSESGLPSVASIISVLQHRATDLIAFSMAVSIRSPLLYPQQPERHTTAADKQYPVEVCHYKAKCIHQ